jgi:hypothetical protein
MKPDRLYSYGEPLWCGDRVLIPVYYSVTFYGPGFGYRQIVPWVLLIVEDDTVSFTPLGEEVTAEDLSPVIKDLFSSSDPCTE